MLIYNKIQVSFESIDLAGCSTEYLILFFLHTTSWDSSWFEFDMQNKLLVSDPTTSVSG